MKQLILTLILALTVLASQSAAAERWYFTGKMGDRVSVELYMETDQAHQDIVAGYIYYPRAKQPAPILVVGTRNENIIDLHEYLADGTVSGNIHILLDDNSDHRIEYGKWTNPKTGASFAMETLRNSLSQLPGDKHPAWWTSDPLTPASIQAIPGQYVFRLWNPSAESMLGGTAEFQYAGEDRVNFDIVNRWYNTAEGQSRNHCPAVLYDNEFEYDMINDCGYAIRAIFFKRFVVVQTASGADSYSCFGPGATLAGVYIKTKSFD